MIPPVTFGNIQGNRQGSTVNLIGKIIVTFGKGFGQYAGLLSEIYRFLVNVKVGIATTIAIIFPRFSVSTSVMPLSAR